MITKPTDREIAMTRLVDAPPSAVFDAWTRPELLREWFFGPRGWTLARCDVDLRIGGSYCFTWRRDADGLEMGVRGTYREVMPFDRLVYTMRFDASWYPGESLCTIVFARQGTKTKITCTVLHESQEARDFVLRTPMEGGVEAGFERLDEALASRPKR